MVSVDVLKILRRGFKVSYLSAFIFITVCIGGRCSSKGPGDGRYALRHSSSGSHHLQAYPNETASSRQYRSEPGFLLNFDDIPQDMLARPLRDGSSDGCLADVPCEKLNAECLVCQFNSSCVYGEEVTVTCEPRTGVKCTNKSPSFERRMVCQYCYQTPSSEHVCEHNSSCQVNSAPRQRYIAQCTVRPNVLCLGRRTFLKNKLCNWTRGYSWWTALLLSIVLGGFGADRFYLGMWQEGIGKLFSFGGLGVWTLVDVVLVATGYLGPADGSLYIS